MPLYGLKCNKNVAIIAWLKLRKILSFIQSSTCFDQPQNVDCLPMQVSQMVQIFNVSCCRYSRVSHRLEKYLNLESFLEKSLKFKTALKSTGKLLISLEFYYFL